MKAKISRGSGFRGALNYVHDQGPNRTGDKLPERVGGNMVGTDPASLSQEFSVVRRLRPDIEKPVWHCSLSLPAGERLDSDMWRMVSNDFMRLMEFDIERTPFDAQRHCDTKFDHIHILASRVSLDGKVWLGQFEVMKAIRATQVLEERYGLQLTPGLGDPRNETKRKRPTWSEAKMKKRTGDELPRERLQRLIDGLLGDEVQGMTVTQFEQAMENCGATCIPNRASTGRMNGYAFYDHIARISFKGSDLGKGYTWAGLQKRGLRLEHEVTPQHKP